MKKPKLRTLLLAPVVLLLFGYVALAIRVATTDNIAPAFDAPPASIEKIAIFGASGTAGDGILEATMANPDVEEIRVITRRTTPRMMSRLN